MGPGQEPAALAAPAAAGAEPLEWHCDRLTYSYPRSAMHALRDVSLRIAAGRCTAVIGPNGSGKSTLLRLLLGAATPTSGTVELGGRPIHDWDRREFARAVGVVPQEENISFPITVHDLVAMGRYPHLGPLRSESAADRAAIDAAMLRCDVLDIRHRWVGEISGGERQRALLARALAQQPRVLALDEPTRALDVRHEMEMFELVRELVATSGVTALLVTHNLNLAARYADTLLLLDRGVLAGAGPPEEVLRRELLEAVYDWPVRITRHPGPGRDTGSPQVTPLARDAGDSAGPDTDGR